MARRGRGLTLAVALLALLAIALARIQPPGQVARTPAEDGLPAWISVYFSAPGRQPDAPDRIDSAFVRFVDGASRSLDVAIYLIDDRDVVGGLTRAAQRGVSVRMVLDSDTLDQPRNDRQRAAVGQLRDAGIPLRGDERPGIMHHKFAVRDGAEVWTGSWNMTESDTDRMNNAALWFRSAELAENYAAEFEQMFSERRFALAKRNVVRHPSVTIDGARIETFFPPRDPGLDALIRRVDRAERSIRFLAFSFTHEGLASAVRSRAASGVDVQGVMERSGSESVYSQYGPLRRAGLNVQVDANPSLMHHKSFILDEGVVVTGSMNFSRNVTRSNDENVLVIEDARLARVFEREYAAIAQEARVGRLQVAGRAAGTDNPVDDRPSD